MSAVYEIPADIKELFEEDAYYRIIDRDLGEMDNNESMRYFIEQVGINSNHILLDDGTQVHFSHPNYNYHIVIDSSGLGDMYSHGFEVTKITFNDYVNQVDSKERDKSSFNNEIEDILNKSEDSISSEDMNKLFNLLYIEK